MVRTFDDFIAAKAQVNEADASHPAWQKALSQKLVNQGQEADYLKRAKYVSNPEAIIMDLARQNKGNQQVEPRNQPAAEPVKGAVQMRSLDDYKKAMADRAAASAENPLATGQATGQQLTQARDAREIGQLADKGLLGKVMNSQSIREKAAEMGINFPPGMAGSVDLTDPKFAPMLDQLGLVAKSIADQGKRRRESGYSFPFYRDIRGQIKASTL
jgi:hypothetical protein